MPLSIAIALLPLVIAPSAMAQQPGENARVHREKAGVLDASGWTMASSTQGAFSVSVPCQYSDYTVPPGKGEGFEPVTVDAIDCADDTGLKFGAGRLAFPNGEAGAQHFFDERSSDFIRRGTFNGLVGGESGMAEHGICLWARLLRAGAENVALTVMGPWRDCLSPPAAVGRFFDSLLVMPR